MTTITNYDEYMQRQPRLQPRVRCIEMEHPSWVSPLFLCIDDVQGLNSGGIFYQFAQISEQEKVIKTLLDYGFDVGDNDPHLITMKTNNTIEPTTSLKLNSLS